MERSDALSYVNKLLKNFITKNRIYGFNLILDLLEKENKGIVLIKLSHFNTLHDSIKNEVCHQLETILVPNLIEMTKTYYPNVSTNNINLISNPSEAGLDSPYVTYDHRSLYIVIFIDFIIDPIIKLSEVDFFTSDNYGKILLYFLNVLQNCVLVYKDIVISKGVYFDKELELYNSKMDSIDDNKITKYVIQKDINNKRGELEKELINVNDPNIFYAKVVKFVQSTPYAGELFEN